MNKLWRFILTVLAVLGLAGAAFAVVWTECAAPVGHIATVNGVSCPSGVVTLPPGTTQLTSVLATAHCGAGADGLQDGADARLSRVELWCWHDADGSGGSSTAADGANPGGWTLLQTSSTALGWQGQAQGLDSGTPAELLARPVTLPAAGPNQRYVLLLRVVGTTGYTNLMPVNGDGTVVGGWAGTPGASTWNDPGEIWSASGTGAYGLTAYSAAAGVAPGAVRYVKIQAGGQTPPGPVHNP
jgi:hypothetical protein